METLIEPLVGEDIAVSEHLGFYADAKLLPDEEALVANSTFRRREEFAAVRTCARSAIEKLGVQPSPILRQDGPQWARRAPRWPEGIVGSMTHCDGYRAAAVARQHRVVTIGIDAEPHAPLPDGLIRRVARSDERARLARLTAARPDLAWDRVLFSAKESVYKAWFPLTGGWLDFGDCEVSLDEDGSFTALILTTGPPGAESSPRRFHGRWRVAPILVGGLVGTAVVAR